MTSPLEQKIDRALAVVAQAEGQSHIRKGGGDISTRMLNIYLAEEKYPPLPADYEMLLRKAYGIVGPYFYLLCGGGMALAGDGLQPGMVQESEDFNRWNDGGEEKVIVVGRMSGGVVVIYKDGKYHVVDESSHDIFETYDDIADFITDTIARKDKARAEMA